ncbi:MAG TPA: hypothetical protein VGQ49_05615 [Bryobacteraceae bacterium]|jgi:hypothetical protein|nr:hypothetical protein [Bryobacteraceae bacterium]
MSELTKEYFEKVVADLATKRDLALLATKEDVHREVREGVEELACMVSGGFEDIRERIDAGANVCG